MKVGDVVYNPYFEKCKIVYIFHDTKLVELKRLRDNEILLFEYCDIEALP